VDSKAECDQLTKLEQPNASGRLVQYRFKIHEGRPEGQWRRGFVKEMSFKSRVKD